MFSMYVCMYILKNLKEYLPEVRSGLRECKKRQEDWQFLLFL